MYSQSLSHIYNHTHMQTNTQMKHKDSQTSKSDYLNKPSESRKQTMTEKKTTITHKKPNTQSQYLNQTPYTTSRAKRIRQLIENGNGTQRKPYSLNTYQTKQIQTEHNENLTH